MSRRSRREHLKDIKRSEDGSLEYTGRTYRFAGGAEEAGRVKMLLALETAAIFLLVILSGNIDAAGANNAFYVIIPYIGEVCCLFAICWYMVKLLAGGDSIREYVLEPSRERIPAAYRILLAFALFGAAASIVYLAGHGFGGKAVKSVLYPVLKVLTAISARFSDKFFAKVEFERSSL